MKRTLSLLTISIATTIALVVSTQTAQAQIGITGVPFLQIEPDSRAAGMGNAGVAVADNAAAVFWNPAGLAFQTGSQISLTHANWLPSFNADLFYDYLVGRHHVEGVGTFGAHITFLNLGEQVRTEAGPGGPTELGRFNSYELSAGVSYGRQLSETFALGAGLRYIHSSLADGNIEGQSVNPGSSVGVDLAALYRSNPFDMGNRDGWFSAGLNLSNLGPGIRYTDNATRDPLPTVLRLGWALKMDLDRAGTHTLTLANDLSKIMARSECEETDDTVRCEAMGVGEALFNSWGSFDRFNGTETVSVGLAQQLMIGVGLEYWFDQLFALRTGYYYEHPENGNREFLTFGAGLRYDIFGVDFSYLYALEEDHPLANTIRLSALVSF